MGNPGVGKSTILNSLANGVYFHSGKSWGQGLTEGLQWVTVGPNQFADTPGLADVALKDKAADAIRDALNVGGTYKIIFVAKIIERRCSPEDIATIGLILEAAPAIRNNYGLIINKIEDDDAADLKKYPNAKRQFISYFEETLPYWCGDAHVMFLKKSLQLTSAKDKFVNPYHLEDPYGTTLLMFWNNLPTVEIIEDTVSRPDIGRLRRVMEKIIGFLNEVLKTIVEVKTSPLIADISENFKAAADSLGLADLWKKD